MKCLTLYQPWASAIAVGLKHYETRSWRTSYRGMLAIHAGAHRTLHIPWEVRKIIAKYRMDYGCIVAVADLADCLPVVDGCANLPSGIRCMGFNEHGELRRYEPTTLGRHFGGAHTVVATADIEHELGDYSPDRYAWELTNVRPLAEPYPIVGHQGLWTVPDDVAAQIMAVLDGPEHRTMG